MELPYSNLRIAHQNPDAQQPLILPVQVICNTSDEAIFANIKANSAGRDFLRSRAPHDGVAVICGSGPSLADHLDTIRLHQLAGDCIVALNGAANFLCKNGITPDYQVMVDAREETADLVCPGAMAHLFASQVHPKCFERAPYAMLWHLEVTGIDDYIPAPPDDTPLTLIGGAASVGNCATCLFYAMGYRKLELFGYDSSHRHGKSHAFHQPLNDGDPCAWVTVRGKEYLTSLTMKLQAEKFMDTAKALQNLGVQLTVHGEGLLPDLWNGPPLEEQEKYQIMWAQPQYREVSPGELVADRALEVMQLLPGAKVIDFGCGTGRGSLRIKELRPDLDLLLIDFAANSRDPAAESLPFAQADLSKPMRYSGDYGFCTDVLEHIPPEQVEPVIRNVMGSCPVCFFQISLVPDVLGGLIGQPLHLSVHPYSWWMDLFSQLGFRVVWSKDQGESACFLVTID